ncbi:MAG: maleylpyruvate isomerase family mycothiol-dependent enzyme [Acidimicrobiia bacterium]|nr:maleylpyruvate isomerase family mycothiol-dependent enzyme [Acidimicrobiia bacterium]
MSSRTETIENLNRCFDDLEALLDGLSEADWGVQSLCPDWTVRGVVEHLVGVEHVLSGWIPTEDDDKPPFEKMEALTAKVKPMSNDELADETKRILATRRSDLAGTTDEEFTRASMTPVGPGTYHRFMDVRVFDFWVHQRDMTGPLGRTTEDSGPAAETALDEVHGSIGYIVGKRIGLPDGMSIAIHVTGPVERDIYAAVDGRAAKVDQLDSPSVELTTDTLTFIQLACGRIDPQGVIDAGKISWSGDDEWGEKAARNLRFTM